MEGKMKKAGIFAIAAALVMSSAGCSNGKIATDDENTIRYWCPLGLNEQNSVTNRGDSEFGKALIEKTGVNIVFEHPSGGNATEKFNVMVAMGSLPDIIEYNWNNYNGGLEKAVENGIVRPIDLKNDAPNLYAYAKENPDVDKWLKTDSGDYYGWPFIRGDRYLQTSAGLMIRKDWLDELGLEIPETIDDWTNVLRAFKKKGVKSPLCLMSWAIDLGAFIGAYNTFDGFYHRDGKVVFGPMEDSYKDFLMQMNAWYEEGLIDADYASLQQSMIQSKMLNDETGAAFGSCGSALGKWISASDGKIDLVGVKYPTMARGMRNEFGHCDPAVLISDVSVISGKSKKVDLAKKVLDYGYSEEGRMLCNFGIEGESYNMVDGYPTYVDSIVHNPDGLSMGVALSKYALAQDGGPFLQDKRYMEQYASTPQQKNALEIWSDTNMAEHLMPSLTLTKEQQTELATLIDSLDTAKDEWQTKFIMGIEPLSDFEKYREDLRNRGIDKYIAYMQEAYDRFESR